MNTRILVSSLLFLSLGACNVGLISPGSGLKAEYFDTPDLSGPALMQIDPQINFDWGGNDPRPGIDGQTYSVRWSGEILAPYSEEYTFTTTTDDGVRLWVNDQQLINQWQEQSAAEFSANLTLEGGRRYKIRMEYYEQSGVASAKLEWKSATLTREVIPSKYLYPAP